MPDDTEECTRVMALRRDAQTHGWDVIPVQTGGKGPLIRGWQTRVFDFQSDHAARANLHFGTPHKNTGCRHSTSVAFDIDVEDEIMVDEIRSLIEGIAGTGLVRQRDGTPRLALFYAKSADLDKTLQFGLTSGGFEVRGAVGSQTVVDGLHPASTPERPVRYRWEELAPWDVSLREVATVTPAMAGQIVETVTRAFPPHGFDPGQGARSALIDAKGMTPQEAGRRVALGEAGMHEATVAMAGHFAILGWPEELALDAMRVLFDWAPPEVRDARWWERHNDLERCLRDIYRKHRATGKGPLERLYRYWHRKGEATDAELAAVIEIDRQNGWGAKP